MSTIKLDRLATDFIKRIPTEFKTAFTPGSGAMPDTHVLDKDIIIDYINRGMMRLFNQKWNEAFALAKGKPALTNKIFMGLLPELVKYSGALVSSNDITGVAYPIESPHLDFFKIVGALGGEDNRFIKVWDESKFTLAVTEEYSEYTATEEDPAVIQVQKILFIFPQDLENFTWKIQYIGLPLNPETGDPLTQDGDYDSPYHEHWNQSIVDLAFELYLTESQA